MAHYERLVAWQHSHALVLEVYQASRNWPKVEQFGLTSQTRRAAVSIVANLVEGVSRRGRRELRHCLDISLGSLGELECLLKLSRDLGYLAATEWAALDARRDSTGRLLWRLAQSLDRALRPKPA